MKTKWKPTRHYIVVKYTDSQKELIQKEFNTSNITEGCLLTHNLIESIPSEYRQEIVKDFFPYDALFHLHIIKYPKGGELNYHTHIKFEKKSNSDFL